MSRPNKYGFINDVEGASSRNTSPYCYEYKLWYNMQYRVFDPRKHNHYAYKSCIIDSSWKYFGNFLRDIKTLPGYKDWKADHTKYSLDKDLSGTKIYSKYTCQFITNEENIRERNRRLGNPSLLTAKRVKCIDTGEEFSSCEEIKRKYGYDASSIHKVCKKINKTAYGKEWIYL